MFGNKGRRAANTLELLQAKFEAEARRHYNESVTHANAARGYAIIDERKHRQLTNLAIAAIAKAAAFQEAIDLLEE